MDASTLPLAAELDDLADALAAHKVPAESGGVVRMARQARRLGAPLGLVDALADPTSEPIVRERAAVLLAAWLRGSRRRRPQVHPAVRGESLRRPAVQRVPVSA